MWDEILNMTFLASFLSAAVRMGVPLAYAALGETVSQKAGTLNIGLEANMLAGAFFGFAAAYKSDSLFLGFICGMLAGVCFSLLHAFFSIYLRQNQNVTGTALNLFALGLTSYLFQVIVNQTSGTYPQISTLPVLTIPVLSKVPLIGDAFFNSV